MPERKTPKKPKNPLQELLMAAKELREHADWMGCPPGYSWPDFKPMFDRADKAIAALDSSADSAEFKENTVNTKS